MAAMRFFRVLFLLAGVLLLAGGPVRAAPQATLSVTMDNPACLQLADRLGTCFIQVRALSATASDQSFTHLDILVNGRVRARLQPFFETTVFASSRMFQGGFQVVCGRPGAGGIPNYGSLYNVTYNGYLVGSASPAASGSATVYCPAYDGRVFLPLTRK